MKSASDSSINNPESDILSPVYFPFTSISPSLVEALSGCFSRVVLYRPVGAILVEPLQTWVDQNFLQIRIPFQDVIDEKTLTSRLRDYRAWGAFHQSTDLAYMKQVRDYMAPVYPETPRIVSEIKGNAQGERVKKPTDKDFAVQLFLHLAQDFDRQSWEVGAELNKFKLQQESLQALLRTDAAEEGEDTISREAFPGPKEELGGLMIENRMGAWNHLFQKDPPESPLLFTDSPAAYAWVLEAAERNVQVLRFSVPTTAQHAHNLPWRQSFEDLLRKLLMTPWSDQLQEMIKEARNRTEQMIDRSTAAMTEPSQKIFSFHWAVIPKQSPDRLLKERFGIKMGPSAYSLCENTIIGFVEDGAMSSG